MKHLTTRILGICLLASTLLSCSKDKTITPNNTASASAISTTGKMAPQENGGTVKGMLSPVPTTSSISLVQGNWLLFGETSADRDGNFMIDRVPALTWDLMIRYTLGNSTEEHVVYVRGIQVQEHQTVDLGTITLD